MGSLSLLQRIFPTQESNRGLLHCRWVLYRLSYAGSIKRPSQRTNRPRWRVSRSRPSPSQIPQAVRHPGLEGPFLSCKAKPSPGSKSKCQASTPPAVPARVPPSAAMPAASTGRWRPAAQCSTGDSAASAARWRPAAQLESLLLTRPPLCPESLSGPWR